VSLHKKGLFIVCDVRPFFCLHDFPPDHDVFFSITKDGLVRLLDVSQLDLDKNQHQQIKMIIDMKTKNIANIDFNSNYSVLSLATDKGIYLYDFQNESMHKKFLSANDANNGNDTGDLHAFVDYSYGPTVAVANLNPYSDAFIVLKQNGMLQVWSIAGSKIINKIFLNMEVSRKVDRKQAYSRSNTRRNVLVLAKG
jgi:WD40 repeat protein